MTVDTRTPSVASVQMATWRLRISARSICSPLANSMKPSMPFITVSVKFSCFTRSPTSSNPQNGSTSNCPTSRITAPAMPAPSMATLGDSRKNRAFSQPTTVISTRNNAEIWIRVMV